MNELGRWRCRNFHAACFLKFCLPDGSHIETLIKHTGPVFTFTDTERCRELTGVYYDSEPIAIGDLKAYIETTKQLKTTITVAQKSDSKKWEKEESV